MNQLSRVYLLLTWYQSKQNPNPSCLSLFSSSFPPPITTTASIASSSPCQHFPILPESPQGSIEPPWGLQDLRRGYLSPTWALSSLPEGTCAFAEDPCILLWLTEVPTPSLHASRPREGSRFLLCLRRGLLMPYLRSPTSLDAANAPAATCSALPYSELFCFS